MRDYDYFLHHPGDEFVEAVLLDGWDHQSLWGWELGYYFLQLWRNDLPEKPYRWITPADHPLPWPGCVALETMRTTGADPVSVSRALRILAPPAVRSPFEVIQRELAENRRYAAEDYCAGQIDAYEWVLGHGTRCPGSGLAWPGGMPTHDDITAEWNINTGLLYDQVVMTDKHASGVDEALSTVIFTAIGKR
ncbi:hypothetical protein [Nocardia sp. NPDC050793]|uniref:hypothetical protein n=1 Tax=Nocardia sp. NPDC050793 TaxID=3155159 RepID=UPI0033EE2BA4